MPQFARTLLRELGLSVYAPNLSAEEQIVCSETVAGVRFQKVFVLKDSDVLFVADAGALPNWRMATVDDYVPLVCVMTGPPMLVLEITEETVGVTFLNDSKFACPVFYM